MNIREMMRKEQICERTHKKIHHYRVKHIAHIYSAEGAISGIVTPID
jgi:hypothetical protein